jgi:cyanophycin synthetase
MLRTKTLVQQAFKKLCYPSLRRNEEGRTSFYARVWQNAADALGAVYVELGDGFCELRIGERSTRIYKGLMMLDDPVTLHLAGNKPLVHKLLSAAGLPVPAHEAFTLERIEIAEGFLRMQGPPCVVKPALDTGGGDGVTTNVRSVRELVGAIVSASLYSAKMLIEKQIVGDSYRLLYLHGKLLHAIHRRSPRVVGDGRSTVRQLIIAENDRRKKESGVTVTNLNIDHELQRTLHAGGLSLNSVPDAGVEVIVKTVVNDNFRDDNFAVTDHICEGLRVECALAASMLGIELAAVDIVTSDPAKSLRQAGGAIIEVNTTPGLHHHYAIANPDKSSDVAVSILRDLLNANN